VTIDQRTTGQATDPDPAWWTLGRKLGAFIVGTLNIPSAIATRITVHK
jgi:hypothetical protein